MGTCLLLCFAFSIGGPSPPPDRWLGEDKLRHFFTSFVATSLATSVARAAGAERDVSIAIGVTAGSVSGVWKEVRDLRDPSGRASVRDLVWDAAGVGAAAAVALRSR